MRTTQIATAVGFLLIGACPETEVRCPPGFADPTGKTSGDDLNCLPIDGGVEDVPSDAPPDVGEDGIDVADAGPCADGCMDPTPMCDTENNLCVACLMDSDCGTATAAKCGDDGMCTACDDSMQCMGIEETDVCAMSGDRMGECVACTPETEETECGDNSCDPATLECSVNERGTKKQCESCVSDSDCGATEGQCVPVSYMGEERGGYCLRPASDICANPFRETFLAISLSGGEEASYCGIRQLEVSCEAVRALLDDDDCTVPTVATDCGDGALCAAVGGAPNKCTYACTGSAECPSVCNTYCGGPMT